MRHTCDNRWNSVRVPFTDHGCHARGRALRIVLICAFATGCSVIRPIYPNSWPAQVKVESDACPPIDGHYQNASDSITYDGSIYYVISLAHKLNGGTSTSPHEADDRLGLTRHAAGEDDYQTIRLWLVADKLNIAASRADGSSRAFDLPIREPCRDSLVILEGKTRVIPYLVANAVERQTLALGRAEDGSLLVLERWAGVGTYIILPVAGSREDWMRFRPVEPVAAQPPGFTP